MPYVYAFRLHSYQDFSFYLATCCHLPSLTIPLFPQESSKFMHPTEGFLNFYRQCIFFNNNLICQQCSETIDFGETLCVPFKNFLARFTRTFYLLSQGRSQWGRQGAERPPPQETICQKMLPSCWNLCELND